MSTGPSSMRCTVSMCASRMIGVVTLPRHPGRVLQVEPQRPINRLCDPDPRADHDVALVSRSPFDDSQRAALEGDAVQDASDAERFTQPRGTRTERFRA